MKRLIGSMAAVGLLLMLAMPVAAAHEAGHDTGGGDKVTLCHATNSASNPFVAIQVDGSGNFSGHKANDGEFHINAKTGLQDFLLSESDFETCDQAGDVQVTPVAPTVSAPTCVAPGVLTLNAVEGVVYTISPVYTAGVSTGAFTVTAAADADEGFVLAPGATTTFNVTVPAQLNCVAALAPSVSAGTCVAPGALTLNAVTGINYAVSPAYTAGATGSFTVSATAASGFTLTGPSEFVVNVPAQLVCNSGTQTGTSTTVTTTTPVRAGTLTSTGVPNTAVSAQTQAPLVLLGMVLLIASASLATVSVSSRRR